MADRRANDIGPHALLPDGAFVVQLAADSFTSPDAIAGAVEHVRTGATARFDDLAGLLRFMASTLTTGGDR